MKLFSLSLHFCFVFCCCWKIQSRFTSSHLLSMEMGSVLIFIVWLHKPLNGFHILRTNCSNTIHCITKLMAGPNSFRLSHAILSDQFIVLFFFPLNWVQGYTRNEKRMYVNIPSKARNFFNESKIHEEKKTHPKSTAILHDIYVLCRMNGRLRARFFSCIFRRPKELKLKDKEVVK